MENYRLFLIYALFLVLFFMWNAWQTDYGVSPLSSFSTALIPDEVIEAAKQAESKESTLSASSPHESGTASHSAISSKFVEVTTDLLAVKISLSDANLFEVQLLEYPVSLKEPNELVHLLHLADPDLFIAQSGVYTAAGTSIIPKDSEFSVSSANYHLAEDQDSLSVPLTWKGSDGIVITKTYIFNRGSYQVDIALKVENETSNSWAGQAYTQFSRTPPESEGFYSNRFYIGAVFSTENHDYKKVAFKDLDSDIFESHSANGWVAMLQHYFVAAWIPRDEGKNYYYGRHSQNNTYITGVVSPQQILNIGESGVFNFTLFIGPKVLEQLAAAAPKLQLTIDYGKLTVIAEPLFWLLQWFYKHVGNWGWAIVLLTIVIKAAFFKLSQTSYRSMAKLRKLHPQLTAIKERFGSDRQKVGQAMIELYKKEKVNPMGGCFPILVQIPVFIALYWMLQESVELRQAPFILWMNDLTLKDPYYVLPLIMGVTMIIQQKLSPTPTDPLQAKVMMLMPITFTFFFALFPAGLVLYWVVNNILSITQQWYITRQIERER
ncbi:membrane protein insertase YidC [Candidatus Nitrosacidococcus sp. I8]|uniref:membrane protein insertase YidC n=1 Tax=Candidatus Nitrosacidococcus sp. I8 TaxID=2942908 RepID=UPI002227C690|nr:membrane protein insertase YidC [Candidatus Nitrosacidococcus sp. I8]CAH9019960.1 Membrane protein insertase YidC [Candidatus Nitrosacidococcus sp. I8]